ncbi:MAG: histidine-type phosphatase, partial [Bacteroidales bacterium]|nr:histidine-type phosphatase [Bacteroidales bacterium]
MKRFYLILSLAVLLIPQLLLSQTTKEEFLSNIKYASGIYQPYDYVKTAKTPAPKDYAPFYISHYGRHGSRWIQSQETYEYPRSILAKAHNDSKLTQLGESVYQRINTAAQDAWKRYGDLSQLGAKEHRAIAERMFDSFPEVFSTRNGKKCTIYSRSTVVPRCILSMAANNEKLKEFNPQIETIREASDRNYYLNNRYTQVYRDSISKIVNNFLLKHVNFDTFLNSLFNDMTYAHNVV